MVGEISNSCGVNASQTKAVVTALVDRLIHYMEIGHGVKLDGFGSFKPSFRAKTAKTSEEATAETVTRKIIRFYPAKAFKDMLEGMSIENANSLDSED